MAWRAVPGGVRLRPRVTPRGGRDAVDGIGALDDGRSVTRARVKTWAVAGAPAALARKRAQPMQDGA